MRAEDRAFNSLLDIPVKESVVGDYWNWMCPYCPSLSIMHLDEQGAWDSFEKHILFECGDSI